MPQNNESIARTFFLRWGSSFDEMCASFEDSFAPQCVWDQRPLALTVGPQEAVKFLGRSKKMMGLATIDVEVLRCAGADNHFLCERIDHLRTASGRLIASAPVTGVLSFDNGKITQWREYYDALDLIKQAGVNLLKAPFVHR